MSQLTQNHCARGRPVDPETDPGPGNAIARARRSDGQKPARQVVQIHLVADRVHVSGRGRAHAPSRPERLELGGVEVSRRRRPWAGKKCLGWKCSVSTNTPWNSPFTGIARAWCRRGDRRPPLPRCQSQRVREMPTRCPASRRTSLCTIRRARGARREPEQESGRNRGRAVFASQVQPEALAWRCQPAAAAVYADARGAREQQAARSRNRKSLPRRSHSRPCCCLVGEDARGADCSGLRSRPTARPWAIRWPVPRRERRGARQRARGSTARLNRQRGRARMPLERAGRQRRAPPSRRERSRGRLEDRALQAPRDD